MGMSGEGAGPGDVAVTDGVEGVVTFTEDPAGTGVILAQGKVIGCDVLLAFGEALLGDGKLVHEGKAEVMLLAREVDFGKAAAECAGGFPTNLPAEASLIAS